MKTKLSKALLFDFFSGHHTSMQKQMIEEWLKDPESNELYYEWLEEWEREHPQYQVDSDAALLSFSKLLQDPAQISLEGTQKRETFRFDFTWASYLAASIVLVALAVYFIAGSSLYYQTFQSGYGEVKKLTLADGSTVVLNANSSLRLPRFGFGSASREVFLIGQAEFNVQHTHDLQKFLVHTPDQLEIEVVGTEFVVYSRPRSSQVILNKGKVVLRNLADTITRPLVIKPGDVVTIQKGKFTVQERQPTQKYTAWKEHRFVFDQTPLAEIAYQVKENFGITIQIQNTEIANRALTGTFEAVSADELLEVVAKVLDVEVQKSGINSRVIKQ